MVAAGWTKTALILPGADGLPALAHVMVCSIAPVQSASSAEHLESSVREH